MVFLMTRLCGTLSCGSFGKPVNIHREMGKLDVAGRVHIGGFI